MTQIKKRPDRPDRKALFEAVANQDAAFKDDLFNSICNEEPHIEWLKEYDGLVYLPIDKVKFLLTFVTMGNWKQEILREYQMLNSIGATVRLHYYNPYTGEWKFHDGTGAVPIQLKQGSKAFELSQINPMAIQKNLPAAVSFAFSNAAANLGKLFGGGLNKKALGHNSWLPEGETETEQTPKVPVLTKPNEAPVMPIVNFPLNENNIIPTMEQTFKIEL